MTYDEFAALDENARRAAFVDPQEVDTLTAERNSLQTENAELRQRAAAAAESERKTKELNFTLARKLNLEKGAAREAEDVLHDMFK